MKKYIDYLFWKRTWFRLFFILIPGWIVSFALILGIGEPDSNKRYTYIICTIIIWILAMIDTGNMDKVESPFIKSELIPVDENSHT